VVDDGARTNLVIWPSLSYLNQFHKEKWKKENDENDEDNNTEGNASAVVHYLYITEAVAEGWT
jgi:hypothetical protein